MLAAKLGFDRIGTNERHQNPYGFMCNRTCSAPFWPR
jgi:hypothetical protein